MTKGRQAFHNTVIGPRLRALRKAMARVPDGRTLGSAVAQGLYWDTHTGKFLRPRREAA